MHLYFHGLLSHVDRKNAEKIAALVDVERQVLQDFIGTAPWAHRPVIAVLVGQVADQLGQSDGIIAFDPSSFPKRGTHSGGGEAPMVWPPGEGRHLPGRRLHGIRLSLQSCLARLPLVSARGMGTRRASTPSMPRAKGGTVSHATGAVLGDARRVGGADTPWLGHG